MTNKELRFTLSEPMVVDCDGYYGVVPAGFKASSIDSKTIALEHYAQCIEENRPGYDHMGYNKLKHNFKG